MNYLSLIKMDLLLRTQKLTYSLGL